MEHFLLALLLLLLAWALYAEQPDLIPDARKVVGRVSCQPRPVVRAVFAAQKMLELQEVDGGWKVIVLGTKLLLLKDERKVQEKSGKINLFIYDFFCSNKV